ncbi:MAG TPA: hypothetical protein VMB71_10865, partial [Acetobacteraceae bacterium]|nr:hypothetical protein [Acetobacteraceae bacterium]
LDETFWRGTLTEGGIAWCPENADIIRTLAGRGIVSAICSKNDPEPIRRILRDHGLDEYFVFADISWHAKGPRLRALVETVQLRAEWRRELAAMRPLLAPPQNSKSLFASFSSRKRRIPFFLFILP